MQNYDVIVVGASADAGCEAALAAARMEARNSYFYNNS